MSTVIMSACWPLQMGPTEKAVLISLADNANDEGLCWPMVRTIARRTCLSDRAVRDAFVRLEKLCVLRREARGLQSNYYWLTPDRYRPAPDAALHDAQVPPAPDAAPPAADAVPPCSTRSQNRKGTVKEPKGEPSDRASRLPADWTAPDEYIAWAVGEQPTWNPAHARKVAEQFRDYWIAKAGKDGRKADWFATWRNWVRREKPVRAAASTALSAAGQQTMQAAEAWLREGGE